MTLVCVPITVVEPHKAAADAEAALRAGADAVEFRFDGMFGRDMDAAGLAAAARLVKGCPLPVIATCRVGDEGGGFEGDDSARAELFEALLRSDAPPRWVDVELASWRDSAALRGAVCAGLDAANAGALAGETRSGLILSTHDFGGRPADLSRRLRAMGEEPRASVHKVAFRARSLRDNLEIAEVLAQRARPTIALAMGEFGLLSRVLAPKWGGFLTFAALRSAEATAPGQPTVDELLGLYRFRSIRRSTRVYGVVGWPVGRSLSPRVHNAGFGAADDERGGLDAVYVPLPVPPEWEHFKATVGAMASDGLLDLGGLSVTAPHKRHLVRLAREEGWALDARAERVGAANTLVLQRGARGRVFDTDGAAASGLVEEAVGGLAGKHVLLLGAGGVARTIGAALLGRGAAVMVHARRAAQAEELAGLLRAHEAPSGAVAVVREARNVRADAVVNCTPAGMEGGGAAERAAIGEDDLAALAERNAALVVMETVYRPVETPLLAWARGLGLRTVDGASMFVRQAEAQFALWTGREPEAGLYDRLVRESLG